MFKYALNIDSEEPIMLLNKQIGMTTNKENEWDGEAYIDGACFQEELMQLDGLGKKRIQVWINSAGGNVIQAMNIYSAILKSKTPVDTYNVGLCASSAGLIFMAGRKRYMADYAQIMMHPVSGDDDAKMYEAFMDACSKMLSPKSKLSNEMIRSMMDSETWLNTDQCKEYGICTDVEATADLNKKYAGSQDIKALLSFSNNILNSKINNKAMKQVTNKLGLAESSNEETISAAIDKLNSARNQAETRNTELTEELTAATTARDEAQQKVDDLQAKLDAANETIDAQTEAAATATATEVVNSFKNRIGDKPEAITAWVNQYKANPEATKAMLEALPLNAKAPGIPGGGGKTVPSKNVAAIMNQINSQTK